MLIAVMAGIAAVGNLTFFMITPFQAGGALIIIAGICLGPEQGFLTGAIARMVVNVFAGQGPWTPWQMFCWGLLGLLGGLCFNRDQEYKKKEFSFSLVAGPLVAVLFSVLIGYLLHLILKWDGSFLGWQLYVFGAIGLVIGLILQKKTVAGRRSNNWNIWFFNDIYYIWRDYEYCSLSYGGWSIRIRDGDEHEFDEATISFRSALRCCSRNRDSIFCCFIRPTDD